MTPAANPLAQAPRRRSRASCAAGAGADAGAAGSGARRAAPGPHGLDPARWHAGAGRQRRVRGYTNGAAAARDGLGPPTRLGRHRSRRSGVDDAPLHSRAAPGDDPGRLPRRRKPPRCRSAPQPPRAPRRSARQRRLRRRLPPPGAGSGDGRHPQRHRRLRRPARRAGQRSRRRVRPSRRSSANIRASSAARRRSCARPSSPAARPCIRLRVGPYSRDDATTMCTALQAAGGQCFIAKN